MYTVGDIFNGQKIRRSGLNVPRTDIHIYIKKMNISCMKAMRFSWDLLLLFINMFSKVSPF